MSEPDKSSKKDGTRRRRTNHRGAVASEKKRGSDAADERSTNKPADKEAAKDESRGSRDSASRSPDRRGDRNRRSRGRDRESAIVEEAEEAVVEEETNRDVEAEDGDRERSSSPRGSPSRQRSGERGGRGRNQQSSSGSGGRTSPRGNDRERSNNNRPPVSRTHDDAQDDSYIDRSTGKTLMGSYNSVLTTLTQGAGYRMESQKNMNRSKVDDKVVQPYMDSYLNITINSMSVDMTSLIRTIVRAHVVYKDSGLYVKSKNMSIALPTQTAYKTPDGRLTLYWDENLVMKAMIPDVTNEDTLILFEVIDDRPSLQSGGNYNNTFVRVAWAFLSPVSSNGNINIDGMNKKSNADTDNGLSIDVPTYTKMSLQLYESVDDDGIIGSLQRSAMNWPPAAFPANDGETARIAGNPDLIPSVYLQWRRHTHKPIIKGRLSVTCHPHNVAIGGDGNTSPDPITGVTVDSPTRMNVVSKESDPNDSIGQKMYNKAKNTALKRLRGEKEACVLPNRLLHSLDVGPEGAMCVEFSTVGNILAVASKFSDNCGNARTRPASLAVGDIYSLKFFDVDCGIQLWEEPVAHHGTIYDIKWGPKDQELVTCSGDSTVKVWKVTTSPDKTEEVTTTKTSQYNSMRNTKAALLFTLSSSAPVYNYCVVFQAFDVAFNKPATSGVDESKGEGKEVELKTQYRVPRLLSGASDGRIRVWEQGNQAGALGAANEELPDFEPIAHNGARVQCLTIDQRSRYLLSGDSAGDILVWKLDVHGFYQSYRRFRQDSVSRNPGMKASDLRAICSGVQSLHMHPNPLKGQVLVMTSAPANLRVFSTSTYRAVSQCKGVNSGIGNKLDGTNSFFSRAIMSPDGKFAVAGVYSDGFHELKVWESNTGDVYPGMISDVQMPSAIRSIAWHPKQHVVAVATLGTNAAVSIYCGERERAEMVVERLGQDAMEETLTALQKT